MLSKIKKSIYFLAIIALMTGSLVFNPLLSKAQTEITEDTQPVYLPLIRKNNSTSIFGVETISLGNTNTISKVDNADIHWVRNALFKWNEIEAVQGTYVWPDTIATNLQNATARGMTVIATVKFTPAWAQKVPPYTCGAIKQDALDDFAAFLQEVVRRYSGYPYNLKYIELGNEPDVAPELVGDNYLSLFGCWGDSSDYYYGGGYYAQMLKVVYPAVKAIDPTVKILIGGLLLAHDYAEPTSHPASRFFEGILIGGGGPYLDIVSFHSYPSWTEPVGLSVEESYIEWDQRGGMIEGKIRVLRELMAKYNIDKPIIQTEAALNCYFNNASQTDTCADPVMLNKFYQAQAEYVVGLYVRNWARGLLGTNWYTIESPGWRYSNLLFKDGSPKPAYYALHFLRNELRDFRYIRQISIENYDPVQLKAYEFQSSAKRVWVLWVADLCMEDIYDPINPYQTCEIDPEVEPPTFSLPYGWQRVLDKYGATITPVNGKITLNNTSPIYIEISP